MNITFLYIIHTHIDATCCEDHIHCCPTDYPICDINTGSCRDSEGINKIGLLKKYDSIAESAFS